MRTFIVAVLAAVGLLAAATPSRAEQIDVDFSLGYGKLWIDGQNTKDLDKADGGAGRVDFTLRSPAVRGLRYGFGIGGSSYRNDYTVRDEDGDRDRRYNDLTLLTPEFRLGYYIPVGRFFIQPSIGVGAAIGAYTRGDYHRHRDYDDDDDDWDDDDEDTIWRLNVLVRPAIQIGYARRHWAVGAEASYMWTHLHFDDGVGGDIGEAYIGAFFRYSF